MYTQTTGCHLIVLSVYIYVHINTHTHIYIHIYICIYISTHIYTKKLYFDIENIYGCMHEVWKWLNLKENSNVYPKSAKANLYCWWRVTRKILEWWQKVWNSKEQWDLGVGSKRVWNVNTPGVSCKTKASGKVNGNKEKIVRKCPHMGETKWTWIYYLMNKVKMNVEPHCVALCTSTQLWPNPGLATALNRAQ